MDALNLEIRRLYSVHAIECGLARLTSLQCERPKAPTTVGRLHHKVMLI
jgi:hypothetical protein